MASTGGGIDIGQLAPRTLLRVCRDYYFAPEAASTTKVVASVDPSSGATVGTALTLQTAVSNKLLRRARRVTMSVTDASYSASAALSVTVLLVGTRWGKYQQEYITSTAVSTSIVTTASVKFYDEIISITPTVISNAASGDALVCGIDGASFGLDQPIRNVADVNSLINVSTNTEASPTAISSTTVDATNSGIQGITLATTDRWEVRYISTVGGGGEGFDSVGVFA